jgi:hypothetical protein
LKRLWLENAEVTKTLDNLEPESGELKDIDMPEVGALCYAIAGLLAYDDTPGGRPLLGVRPGYIPPNYDPMKHMREAARRFYGRDR